MSTLFDHYVFDSNTVILIYILGKQCLMQKQLRLKLHLHIFGQHKDESVWSPQETFKIYEARER